MKNNNDLLHSIHKDKTVYKGKILFYDQLKSEGIVIEHDTQEHYFFHHTSIIKNSSPIKQKGIVSFTLYTNGYMSQVNSIKIGE